MNTSHRFNFGTLEFHDSYAIITCDESVNISYDEITELQKVLYPHYDNRYYGLIANRINHYSVNPVAIDYLFSDENLIGGAIVSSRWNSAEIALCEIKCIGNAPIRYFSNLGMAALWIKNEVLQAQNQANPPLTCKQTNG